MRLSYTGVEVLFICPMAYQSHLIDKRKLHTFFVLCRFHSGVGWSNLFAMATFTILSIEGMSGNGLKAKLRNNDSGKTFSAIIKNAVHVEVYPCKADYSGFTDNPFICQLPMDRQSAIELKQDDIIED